MKIERDHGLFIYAASPPNDTGWAVLPGVAWMPSWMTERPDWYREKARVHERVHWWRQQIDAVAGGAVIVGLVSLIAGVDVGWNTLLWTVVGAAAGLFAWYLRYGVSPSFRLDVEVEAEAAEKAHLIEDGRWHPTAENIAEYAISHLDNYYGRFPLFGSPPAYADVRSRFRRALAAEGVDLRAEEIR